MPQILGQSLDWSTIVPLAQVVGTVGGLLLVWWKVKQIREVSAFELLRNEQKRFNSPEMRKARARLAQSLLTSPNDYHKIEDDGEDVLAFFEDLGLLLRRRIVPDYFVWSMLSDEIIGYGQLLGDYIAWLRRTTGDRTYYVEFALLRSRIAALHKKKAGVELILKAHESQEFLENELKLVNEK